MSFLFNTIAHKKATPVLEHQERQAMGRVGHTSPQQRYCTPSRPEKQEGTFFPFAERTVLL